MTTVLVAVLVSFIAAMVATPWLIAALRSRGVGQPIHDAVALHSAKAGTPTMGGAVVPIGLVVAYAIAHLVTRTRPAASGLLVLGVTAGACLVGVGDDWLKVRRERNLGLREGQKTVALLVVSVLFAASRLTTPNACTRVSFTRCNALPIDLGPVLWVVFAVAVIWLTANAFNFTDGVDGLASGSAALTFSAFAVIAFWEFRHPELYHVSGALDLAVIAAALAAGCAGFLWWNRIPASIFMGDTGSLALGTAMAALALSLDVALLLPILGALYVIEFGSSSLQRYWFKLTRKRLFKMAPIHHHFELLGWPESTIIIRFWILAGLAAALGIGVFYADALKLLG
ncbi:MAG TPA: phospho-N-acetylmuramoyl-pentapeptide-transferase [Acidimicrobiales bacterium]|nr:phospho-N-acetylmuramoyl-pentapeptide-transferase [Acidimicrobiales bacterium]